MNTLSCELTTLDAMNSSEFYDMKNLGLQARGSRFYEQVRVMDEMNDSQS